MIGVVREQGSLAAYRGDVMVARMVSGVVWWLCPGVRPKIDWSDVDDESVGADDKPPVCKAGGRSEPIVAEANADGKPPHVKQLRVKGRGVRLIDMVTRRFTGSGK